MPKPSLSVIILSYNRPQLLAKAIASVLEQSFHPDEIIVVDNQSSLSDEIASVVRAFDKVRFVSQPNTGFSGGMNRGLESASSEYIYLTEDDIVLEPDCLGRLMDAAAASPAGGLYSPIIVDADTRAVRYAGGEIDRVAFRFDMWIEPKFTESPYKTTFIGGASILGHRDVLARLGGFRSDFFVYQEDVEFSIRASRLGIDMLMVPKAVAVHAITATEMSEIAFYHSRKNSLAMAMLHGNGPAIVWQYFGVFREAVGLVRRQRFSRSFTALRAMSWPPLHLRRLLADRLKLRHGRMCWDRSSSTYN